MLPRGDSFDLPSGMNHITGECPDDEEEDIGTLVCRADMTCNLHMLKRGPMNDIAKPFVGELWTVEAALGYPTFASAQTKSIVEKFNRLYATGPIQKVPKI